MRKLKSAEELKAGDIIKYKDDNGKLYEWEIKGIEFETQNLDGTRSIWCFIDGVSKKTGEIIRSTFEVVQKKDFYTAYNAAPYFLYTGRRSCIKLKKWGYVWRLKNRGLTNT